MPAGVVTRSNAERPRREASRPDQPQPPFGRVLDLIEHVHLHGVTIVMITHDSDVAARATRRLTITDGVVAEPSPLIA